jgi:two-component system sensor histidine kinase YesM
MYEFDIDDSVYSSLIPKLTLQPLVENALLHGIFEKMDGDGLIAIRAVKRGDDIELTVRDNGAGMDADKLSGLAGRIEQSQSYGLYNVQERLRLFFGGDSTILIESEPGSGTQVTLKIENRGAAPAN